jgi:hypothetical protein
MVKKNKKIVLKLEIIIVLLLITLFCLFLSLNSFPVNGGVGTNVTVITYLQVGSVAPEVLNVSFNAGGQITLQANTTRTITCEGLIRDWNNDSDIQTVVGVIYNSSYGSPDDNNDHYTNSSCTINRSFGSWGGIFDTNYTAVANCSFNMWYYSNPGNWTCNLWVNDSVGLNANASGSASVAELLAIGLPTDINYGVVNATYVSNENISNVTNFGNIKINLSLQGYAVTQGDNYSMNCSLGSNKNIPIYYEKFNLTTSTPGAIANLAAFEARYMNLTGNVTIRRFDQEYRHNDTFDDAVNQTYWRIYVPVGVAGSCQGNIIFGAVKASGL